jgi:phosphatidylinositol alpha-mannosyltransferase
MATNKKLLRISFVYDDSLDGSEGVTQYVKLIGSWFSAKGHNVSYFVGQTKISTYEGGKVYSLARNIPVSFNGNKLSIPLPAKKSAIKNALAQAQPDVLHIQMPHSPMLAQRTVNQAKNAAVVGTFHIFPANAAVRLGTKLLKLAYWGGLRKFDTVVSVSSAAQSFAKTAFSLNTEIVPNAVDIARFKSNTSNTPFKIVFLGRLVERKGARHLIKAFAKVCSEFPQARLVIAGSGEQSGKLKQLCQDLNISPYVEFPGFVSEEEKVNLLASAHIACFPSLYGESFGIVLIEAMAAGSGLVVGGNNPGYTSVLSPQPDLLIDPRDSEIFADHLIKLLKDKQLQDKLHRWQTEYVKRFDVNLVASELETIYRSAIDKKTRRSHN